MSNPAITWAFALDIPSTRKFVLIALADHADSAGLSFPGVAKLVAKTSLKERTVQQALSALEADGLISTANRRGGRPGGGKGAMTAFLLHRDNKGACDGRNDKGASDCNGASDCGEGCGSLHTRVHLTAYKGASDCAHIDNPQELTLKKNPPEEPTSISPPRVVIEKHQPNLFAAQQPTNAATQPSAVALPQRRKARAQPTNEETPEFVEFWQLYPRKRDGRGKALQAWRSAVKKADASEIIAGLKQFQFDADPQYHPMPATWLNGVCWVIEQDTAPPTARVPAQTRKNPMLNAVFDHYQGKRHGH